MLCCSNQINPRARNDLAEGTVASQLQAGKMDENWKKPSRDRFHRVQTDKKGASNLIET